MQVQSPPFNPAAIPLACKILCAKVAHDARMQAWKSQFQSQQLQTQGAPR